MATNLTFTKRESPYKEYCEITPVEPTVIQVEREDKGFFTVYANLDGMEPVSIFNATILKDLIFELDVPEGVKVTMESGTHVVDAKMQ